MGAERRRKERFNANLFVDLSDERSGDSIGRGVVVDVSLSGLAIDTEADLTRDTIVKCQVEIPLELRAKVVRQIAEGQIKRYGLHIVGQSFLEKFLLKKFLKGNRQTRKVV